MSIHDIHYYRDLIDRGCGVLVYHYPGYGNTAGNPTEESCYAALRGASDFLRDRQKIPVNQQVAYGISLGGAVTAQVATERQFKAVILQSTMTRFQDVVKNMLPSWLPLHHLLSGNNCYATVDKLNRIPSRLLILHGESDALMPFDFVRQFKEKRNQSSTGLPTTQIISYPQREHMFDIGSQDTNAVEAILTTAKT